MTAQAFLDRLEAVRSRGLGRWSARCPAHADKSPSLSIGESNTRILVHCFSGCEPEEIVTVLGLKLKDLFTDNPIPHGQRPTSKPQKLDLIDVAFQFDLAALDRRLRADAVLQAVGNFNDDLSDQYRDRLMNAVACAYGDRDRAEFLESVADGFRWKAYTERTKDHAA